MSVVLFSSEETPTPTPVPQTGQQGPLPFLEFCGVEVANAARTIEYLRNGLGDTVAGHWMIGDGDLCPALYTDTFISPALDPAPWYDASEPGSSSFLGIVLTGISGYGGTVQRTMTARPGGLQGVSFQAQRRSGRVWEFKGGLISADDVGAEYGLRWLISTLENTACDTCSTCYLVVKLACPPDSDPSVGEWISYEVALTEGPRETTFVAPGQALGVLGGCRDLIMVEWTMVAGNPLLYKRRVECMPPTLLQD